MTGPPFDFQGDPVQQGGTLILGPGKHESLDPAGHFSYLLEAQRPTTHFLHKIATV